MKPTLPHQLTEVDLRPGDLLLARNGRGVGWLMRWLDRAEYCDVGLYDGERVIVCGPCGVERRPLYPADVYRFHHDGRFLDSGMLAGGMLPALLRAGVGDGRRHRCTPLYALGLLLIMRRPAESGWQRMLVEAFGGILVAVMQHSLGRRFSGGATALSCPELIARLFLTVAAATGRPCAILVEPEARHASRAWPPTSGRLERLMQDIEEILARVNPELPIAISRARSTAPGRVGVAVQAGSPLAPACFVTPGDLQHSPSFVPIGRLVFPAS